MPDTICSGCELAITNSQILKALGKQWHPEHFQCKSCQGKISENNFKEKDGWPVCLKCFTDKYAPICCHCNQKILEKAVQALNKTWHNEHFKCHGICGLPLAGKTFYERDGKVYCQTDYEKLVADRCEQCNQSIISSAISALNVKWHPDCFKCKKCNKLIEEETFFVEGKRPVCKKCASEVKSRSKK